MQPLESAIALIFPQKCMGCGVPVGALNGFCGSCWPQIRFISGKVCDGCGVELAGPPDGYADHCDSCLDAPPDWSAGRAALYNAGMGGRLYRRLRGGADPALMKLAADWMRGAAQDIIERDMIVVPQPLAWMELVKNKQSALAILGRHIAIKEGLAFWPDLLAPAKGRLAKPVAGAQEVQIEALLHEARVLPRYSARVKGRKILLVADRFEPRAADMQAVRACCAALWRAGAERICVIALAHGAPPP